MSKKTREKNIDTIYDMLKDLDEKIGDLHHLNKKGFDQLMEGQQKILDGIGEVKDLMKVQIRYILKCRDLIRFLFVAK